MYSNSLAPRVSFSWLVATNPEYATKGGIPCLDLNIGQNRGILWNSWAKYYLHIRHLSSCLAQHTPQPFGKVIF